ncbi:MAG: hypothetical protein ACHQYQ_01290 [Bacteriovoracales bacterium]
MRISMNCDYCGGVMLEIDGEWTCIFCWDQEINEQAKGDKEIGGRAQGSQEKVATQDETYFPR